MNVVLTICSANYLAHAKTLGASLKVSNPHYKFVIGLVDRVPAELDPNDWQPYELLPVEDLDIPGFDGMARKYDLVELNTAAKPFYIEHLYRRDPAVQSVIYLDPDIFVFGSFQALQAKLADSNLIVTPHSCTYDNSALNIRYEIAMLCTGIYNLGFIATSRSETTFAFLNWWETRLQNHCYYRPGSGVFVDQLWITLAHLYFSGFQVEMDPGYNMCYWNHIERRLEVCDGRYVVNGQHALIFYHFSSYNPLKPDAITSRPNDPTQSFAERPDLRPLYDDYRRHLLSSGFERLRHLPYAFNYKQEEAKRSAKGRIRQGARRALGALPKALVTPLKRLALFTADICPK